MTLKNNLNCVVIIVLLSFGFVICNDLPETFQKCQRDENFDKCLVEAVNKAIPLLKNGNEDFGIPPLEPLEVKSLVVDAGTPPINLKQNLKDVKIYDLISTSRVTRYRTDLDKYLIICDSKTDRMQILSDYTMSGRILLLPITGSGKSNITLTNTRIEHRLIGEPYEKDGVKYMKLKEYKIEFHPKRVYMNFENLFNDKTLSETMNKFLNDNWETVFSELKLGYQKNMGKIFKDLSNKIFTKVPFDKIFLKS